MADGLYCNIVFLARKCIAIGGLKGWKIVFQYRELYCNEACK